MKPAFQRRAFWSFAGLALLGFAGWETVQTALAGRNAAGFTLPPPLRTRSGERPMLRRETAAGDPIANYLARAKRGMTEREVRWMLEDFEAAGLDRYKEALTDFAVAKALRKKQEEWYLAALCEGLSLTPEQREGAKAKLAALFARDLQRITELEKQLSNPSEEIGDESLAKEKTFKSKLRFGCFLTGSDSSCAPWNLADLTEAQTSLTLKFWRIEEWKREIAADPFAPEETPAEPDDWLYEPTGMVYNPDPFSDPFAPESRPTLQKIPGVPTIQDPATGNLMQVPDIVGGLPAFALEGSEQLLSPFLPCGSILPLTPDQMPLWEKSYDLAAQALLCHPAQLRLALLQQPELAKILREELDHDPSERGLKIPIKPAAPSPSE